MSACGCRSTGHDPGCPSWMPTPVLATEQFIRGDCIDVAARLADVLNELDAVRAAGNALLDVALVERDEWQRHAIHLYWFHRMTMEGGPDGSDADEAVEEDARAAAAHVEKALGLDVIDQNIAAIAAALEQGE